jgi:hypothetical protein
MMSQNTQKPEAKQDGAISNIVLWNIILLVITILLLIKLALTSDGEDVGATLLLFLISPILLCTIAIDIYRVVKKLVTR